MVILGGGITAAINAITLVEAGIPCVLIEKRSIGLGSTIATTALLQYQIDHGQSAYGTNRDRSRGHAHQAD
ncbi:MAG: NAD(P)-binding protein [Methylosarcina sp.]